MFYRGVYGITLGINILLSVVIMSRLRVLWQDFDMLLGFLAVGVFLVVQAQFYMLISIAGWLVTSVYSFVDGITLGLGEGIEIGFCIYILRPVVIVIMRLLLQE